MVHSWHYQFTTLETLDLNDQIRNNRCDLDMCACKQKTWYKQQRLLCWGKSKYKDASNRKWIGTSQKPFRGQTSINCLDQVQLTYIFVLCIYYICNIIVILYIYISRLEWDFEVFHCFSIFFGDCYSVQHQNPAAQWPSEVRGCDCWEDCESWLLSCSSGLKV